MLLGNYTSLNSNPGRAIGGFTNVYSNYKIGGWYSSYDPDANPRQNARASFPTGTQPPYSWLLAPKGGELSSTTRIGGTSSLTAAMAMGRAISADLVGSGSLSGSMALISSISATLAGSSNVSASLSLSLALLADLVGSGDLAGSMNLLVKMESVLAGQGELVGTLRGDAYLAANIYVSQASADVQQIVDGVWSALAADYNVSGTMGEKLNGAGSAGDPWTTDLSGYNTSGTAGKILKAALSTNMFIALK